MAAGPESSTLYCANRLSLGKGSTIGDRPIRLRAAIIRATARGTERDAAMLQASTVSLSTKATAKVSGIEAYSGRPSPQMIGQWQR